MDARCLARSGRDGRRARDGGKPPVAERIGLDPLHFVQRQAVYLPMAVVIMLGVSLMSLVGARRLAIIVFSGAVVLLIMTLASGTEN